MPPMNARVQIATAVWHRFSVQLPVSAKEATDDSIINRKSSHRHANAR